MVLKNMEAMCEANWGGERGANTSGHMVKHYKKP